MAAISTRRMITGLARGQGVHKCTGTEAEGAKIWSSEKTKETKSGQCLVQYARYSCIDSVTTSFCLSTFFENWGAPFVCFVPGLRKPSLRPCAWTVDWLSNVLEALGWDIQYAAGTAGEGTGRSNTGIEWGWWETFGCGVRMGIKSVPVPLSSTINKLANISFSQESVLQRKYIGCWNAQLKSYVTDC